MKFKNVWQDNAVQFPRLIAEIRAVGLTESQWDDLLTSMDLRSEQLDQLFCRAERQWEKVKKEAMKCHRTKR